MPDVPAPEGLMDWEDLRVQVLGPGTVRRPDGPLEVRDADPASAAPAAGRPARRRLWIRPREPLPDDPLLHAAVLAYASDRGLLSTAGRPHGLMWGVGWARASITPCGSTRRRASTTGCCSTRRAPRRATAAGSATLPSTRRDGVRIGSVTQEGLIRVSPRRAAR